MSLERLGELLRKFEDIYAGTGAGAKLNLRDPETDLESNVELHFTQAQPHHAAGLYVIVDQGSPMRLDDAPPAIQARVAQHLPELAKMLDETVAIIEVEVDAGTQILQSWFGERDV
jgi:hypothetical protein